MSFIGHCKAITVLKCMSLLGQREKERKTPSSGRLAEASVRKMRGDVNLFFRILY